MQSFVRLYLLLVLKDNLYIFSSDKNFWYFTFNFFSLSISSIQLQCNHEYTLFVICEREYTISLTNLNLKYVICYVYSNVN
ncbi:hypothetical protein HanRHA438_Chr02g0081041 [Helianthus annuus]|nr:hypothetical protein HanRHA438_Chr02g0081041 [Helianthus annuus]